MDIALNVETLDFWKVLWQNKGIGGMVEDARTVTLLPVRREARILSSAANFFRVEYNGYRREELFIDHAGRISLTAAYLGVITFGTWKGREIAFTRLSEFGHKLHGNDVDYREDHIIPSEDECGPTDENDPAGRFH